MQALSQRRYGSKSCPTVAIGAPVLAEQPEVVGDVARAAAEVAPHARHEERHVQHVDPVREDLLAEAALEDHDGVEGDRAADEGSHGEVG